MGRYIFSACMAPSRPYDGGRIEHDTDKRHIPGLLLCRRCSYRDCFDAVEIEDAAAPGAVLIPVPGDDMVAVEGE